VTLLDFERKESAGRDVVGVRFLLIAVKPGVTLEIYKKSKQLPPVHPFAVRKQLNEYQGSLESTRCWGICDL
jgi:hypothetical protein